jgi:hypothetical protein
MNDLLGCAMRRIVSCDTPYSMASARNDIPAATYMAMLVRACSESMGRLRTARRRVPEAATAGAIVAGTTGRYRCAASGRWGPDSHRGHLRLDYADEHATLTGYSYLLCPSGSSP